MGSHLPTSRHSKPHPLLQEQQTYDCGANSTLDSKLPPLLPRVYSLQLLFFDAEEDAPQPGRGWGWGQAVCLKSFEPFPPILQKQFQMQVLDDQSEYIYEELLENHQDFYTVFCGNLGFTEGLRTFFRGMRLQVGYFLKNEVRFSGVFLERVFLSFDVQIMLPSIPYIYTFFSKCSCCPGHKSKEQKCLSTIKFS